METEKNLILSVDVGTGSLKAGIFQYDGIMRDFRRYHYDKKQISWADLQFLRDFEPYLRQTAVIAVSAQSPSIVPLLENGSHGTPFFYFDQNTNLRREGCPSVFLPKAAYHKKHFPKEYEQTRVYLSFGDYLIYLLTGKTWTSLPQKAYDRAVWTENQIIHYELDKNKFPPYLLSEDTAGHTIETLPCPSGIRVLGSTYDFLSALEGLDALHPDIAGDRSGSSLGLNFFFTEQYLKRVSAEKPLPELNWNIYPHARTGCFNAGLLFTDFDDFLELLKQELQEKETADLLARILPQIPKEALRQAPYHISQSFLELYRMAEGRDALERACRVFTDYGRIIRFALHHWPLCKIREVRCSGGPNENPLLTAFKERASGLPYKQNTIVYTELLGNVYRARKSTLQNCKY